MSDRVYTVADLQDWPSLSPPAKLSVFGDPVAHSLSPEMHNPGLLAAGIDAQYIKLHVRPEELPDALRGLQANGFFGTNVTIPHKATIAELMDEVTETAGKIGAVNTVKLEGDRLIGHNSDGPGFQRAIEESFGVTLKDLRVLLLGAGGGAGRAVAVQCALESCLQLALVNRTVSKAEALAKELSGYYAEDRLKVGGMMKETLEPLIAESDLIINGTSMGMKITDPVLIEPSQFQKRHLVYDMIYAPPKTRLLADAEEAGAKIANGLTMLLWQGAISFEFWFGKEAPIDEMRNGLYSAIKGKAG